MIEIFTRDRGIDYEMVAYQDGIFRYITKEKNARNNKLYREMNEGTIILDGMILNHEAISLEQIEHIKGILDEHRNEIESYKKDYKPVYVRYTSGSDILDMVKNQNVIEIPNSEQINEWVCIRTYDYLEQFIKKCNIQEDFGGFKKVKNLFRNINNSRK